MGLTTRGAHPAVFSVSTRAAQIEATGAVGRVIVEGPGAPLAEVTTADLARVDRRGRQIAGRGDRRSLVAIEGLVPSSHYTLRIDTQPPVAMTTLAEPGGALVARVATISDLHVGQRVYSHAPVVRALPATGPCDHRQGAAMRCLSAAIDEINAWRPDLIVVKGDIAHTNELEEYELAASELQRLDAPLLITPGNHDGGDYRSFDFSMSLRRLGFETAPTQERRFGPWRVITANTVVAGRQTGSIVDGLDELVERVADGGPCLIALHHQLMWRRVPHYVPRGIPAGESAALIRRLTAVNPQIVITSGHTHRNRVHHRGGLIATEVGSTKDFPGVWAAYELHESGLTQSVRRISNPAAVAWVERTRFAAYGAWERWAPGTLADRCFSHTWAPRD